MAIVRPFPALHYKYENNFSKLIAPPYDVISRAKREELLKRSPFNSIRIILGDPSTLTEAELKDVSRYEAAANTLAKWKQQQVLIQDDQPAMYLLREEFRWKEKTLERLGILVAVKLEELGTGRILPHEMTLATPIQDRYQLMKATQIQESPIYLVCKEEDGNFRALLNRIWSDPPDVSFQNLDEPIVHSFLGLRDQNEISKIMDLLKPKPFLIADGHHRYSTALHYSKNEGKNSEAAQYVLAYLTAVPDPGVVLSAIHRIFVVPYKTEELIQKLSSSFTIQDRKISWEEFETSTSLLALVLDEKMYLLKPQDTSLQVPSELLNERVVKPILGLDLTRSEDQKKVQYIKQADELPSALREKKGIGFWLKPLAAPQVIDIAESGKILPQKSTFFYPKVMSGLVFYQSGDTLPIS